MFTPRHCGVKYDPPTLVLYYMDHATNKVHRRSMPLRNFTVSTDVAKSVTGLKDGKHKRYLEKVPSEQLQRLLSKIQEHVIKSTKETEDKTTKDKNDNSDNFEDLNKLSDSELNKKKAEMDTVFEVNRVKPGDENFEYDIDVDFEGGKNISGWDSEEYSEPDF